MRTANSIYHRLSRAQYAIGFAGTRRAAVQPTTCIWSPATATSGPEPGLARPRPVGILDWDFAARGRLMDDVAYALGYSIPFRSRNNQGWGPSCVAGTMLFVVTRRRVAVLMSVYCSLNCGDGVFWRYLANHLADGPRVAGDHWMNRLDCIVVVVHLFPDRICSVADAGDEWS